MLAISLLSALSVAAVFALIGGVMWLAARYVHAFLAVGIGCLAILYFVQGILRGMITCAQPPEYIPPQAGEAGEGRMVFNCDAAGGLFIYQYLYFFGPLLVAGLIWLTLRHWRLAARSVPESIHD